MKHHFQWIEFQPRPKKDGLHDSGYRYIRLTGVTASGEHIDLGEWHDHLIVEPSCNIDVTPEGTIRIMAWHDDPFHLSHTHSGIFTSSAWIRQNGEVL